MLGNLYSELDKKNKPKRPKRRGILQFLRFLLFGTKSTTPDYSQQNFELETENYSSPVPQSQPQTPSQNQDLEPEPDYNQDYTSKSLSTIEFGTEVNIDSESQLEFGLQQSKVSDLSKFRQTLKRWENIVEVLPYWKQAINPINLTTSIVIGIGVVLMGIYVATSVSGEGILFFSTVEESHITVSRLEFLMFTIAIAVMQVVLLRLERQIFNFDRRLSASIAGVHIFANFILTLAMLQLLILMLA